MTKNALVFLFIASMISACISGPPPHLRDNQVMWIELKNTPPTEARALIIQTIESGPFGCKTNEFNHRIGYGCGQGSADNNQQVKGYCQASPTTPSNSVCDVFFLNVKVTGLFKSRYSQPEQPRKTLEMSILKATGAVRIERPVKYNSLHRDEVGLSRLGDK